MEHKHPFSLYDFLGFFIPGALSFFLLYIIGIFDEMELLNRVFFTHFNLLEKSIAFVIFSYVAGHTLNYLSSLTIERYSIWMVGYFSYFLLHKDCKRSYFKKVQQQEIERLIRNQRANSCIVRLIRRARIKFAKSKFCLFRKLANYRLMSTVWRTLLYICLLPMVVLDLIIGGLFRFRLFYTNPLDANLSTTINEKITLFIAKHKMGESNGSDYFRAIYHYYYEHCINHRSKFDNYIALYGFTRSLSLIFCILSWFIIIVILIGHKEFSWNNVFFVLMCSCLSYIFYTAFVKFYRRFTLEGFMCLVIDENLTKENCH